MILDNACQLQNEVSVHPLSLVFQHFRQLHHLETKIFVIITRTIWLERWLQLIKTMADMGRRCLCWTVYLKSLFTVHTECCKSHSGDSIMLKSTSFPLLQHHFIDKYTDVFLQERWASSLFYVFYAFIYV